MFVDRALALDPRQKWEPGGRRGKKEGSGASKKRKKVGGGRGGTSFLQAFGGMEQPSEKDMSWSACLEQLETLGEMKSPQFSRVLETLKNQKNLQELGISGHELSEESTGETPVELSAPGELSRDGNEGAPVPDKLGQLPRNFSVGGAWAERRKCLAARARRHPRIRLRLPWFLVEPSQLPEGRERAKARDEARAGEYRIDRAGEYRIERRPTS